MRKRFSKAERVDYMKRLLEIEQAKAKERMAESGGEFSTPAGKSRDIVSEQFGISSNTMERINLGLKSDEGSRAKDRVAEQRIGEILLNIPTAQGRRTDLDTSSTGIDEVKTKTETAKEMGYSKDDVSDYQQMAKHPEVVEKVIKDALANGDVVTKSSVMKEIRAYKERIRELENREPENKLSDKNI